MSALARLMVIASSRMDKLVQAMAIALVDSVETRNVAPPIAVLHVVIARLALVKHVSVVLAIQ